MLLTRHKNFICKFNLCSKFELQMTALAALKLFRLGWSMSHCRENWEENRHSPQHICSMCKIDFFNWKKHGCLSELISQMVMYLHTSSHIKPWRVKTRMQMRAGRKEHKNHKRCHSASFTFALDKNWLKKKQQSV